MILDALATYAAIIFFIAYFPQIRLLLVKKRSEQLSLSRYLMVLSGLIAWCAYAVLSDALSMFLAYFITVIEHGAILGLVLWYRKWPGGRRTFNDCDRPFVLYNGDEVRAEGTGGFDIETYRDVPHSREPLVLKIHDQCHREE